MQHSPTTPHLPLRSLSGSVQDNTMVVRLRAGWHGRLDAKLTTPHPLCCLTLDLSSTTDYSYAPSTAWRALVSILDRLLYIVLSAPSFLATLIHHLPPSRFTPLSTPK